MTIEDPERLLLNQIPLEPVVQFYLDAPTRETVRAHLEFLYGEDRVTPEEPGPAGLLRDARPESGKLIQTGTTNWMADVLVRAGGVLLAAGYLLERKRKSMFHKAQH